MPEGRELAKDQDVPLDLCLRPLVSLVSVGLWLRASRLQGLWVSESEPFGENMYPKGYVLRSESDSKMVPQGFLSVPYVCGLTPYYINSAYEVQWYVVSRLLLDRKYASEGKSWSLKNGVTYVAFQEPADDLLRNLDPWKNIFHEFLRRQHVSDARILDA